MKRKYKIPNINTLFPNYTRIHPKRRAMHALRINEKSYNEQLIHNLSTYKPTNDEMDILHKGLNFCLPPTPQDNLNTTQDMEKFVTRINNRIYFHENPTTNQTQHPFRTKSNWTAPQSNHETINTYINAISHPRIHITDQHIPSEQYPINMEAIQSLKHNNNITIKKADKGGGICILDKKSYINQIMHEHLSNKDIYEPIDFNPTVHIRHDICTFIKFINARHHIDSITQNYITPPSPCRTPIFYGLPKIHKKNHPLRPIVSGFDSPTDNLARYITHFIQPLATKTPAYIQDTKHFLRIINDLEALPQNAILVSADVTSLYTNIPHDEGIEATAFYINKWREHMPKYAPNTQVFKSILHNILKNSFFRFMDNFYIQKRGTSMGGRYAPPYANLFMAKLEDPIIQEWKDFILLWKRFIDDIFFIFLGTEEELHQFQTYMNHIHPTIKFTFETSRTAISFLDTIIYINNDRKLCTRLYKKPTDKSMLLHFHSHHPMSTKESIIYSQALRYNMIISEDSILQDELYNLTKILLARKYPLHIINQNIIKALQFSQTELIYKNKQENTDVDQPIPFITKYTDTGKKLKQMVNEHWHILTDDPYTNNIFPQTPINAFQKLTTIGNVLVRTDTKP